MNFPGMAVTHETGRVTAVLASAAPVARPTMERTTLSVQGSSATVELRVLAGPQAGCRLPLNAGMYRAGADE